VAVLKMKQRKRLSSGSFALPAKAPGSGSYPINDAVHARNALSRVAQHGSSAEKAKVRAAVARKYPGIGQRKKRAAKRALGR
jgi:hypothetical protein